VHPGVHDTAITAPTVVVGRTINAKMYATESIAVDEVVHEIARDSGNEYHHPWKSDTVP